MEMTRRNMFAATSAVALTTFTRSALGDWEPSERYPDPAIKSLDPSFNRYRLFNASIERLATGMRWCEGPVYFGDARCLIWSDIPNNRLMRYDEVTSAVSIYREPSNHANGNRRDRQGRLVTCEHETRRITRTEYDGTITVLIDNFEGKRLNSPNDISVKSDELDLVLRSALRHPEQLPGKRFADRITVQHLSPRSQNQPSDRSGGHAEPPERRRVFARRNQMLHPR